MQSFFKFICTLCLVFAVILSADAKKGKKAKAGADPTPFGSPEHTAQNKGGFTTNRIPLGVLGAYGIITVGTPTCMIDKVIEGGTGAKNGLKVGDLITGVNGKKIEKNVTGSQNDGYCGPQEDIGFGIEEGLKNKYHKMTLSITRDGKPMELTITLPPKLKPFGPSYPFDDERSDEVLAALTEKLVEIKGDRMNIGGAVQSCTAGLGMMGSYNLKLTPHCRDIARWMTEQEPAPGGLPAWNLNYSTTYLCEYYLATHEKFVLPAIEKRLKVHEDWISPEGKVGHGKEVGYKGAGINIIGSHHYMNFGLMNRCGIKVDEVPWNNLHKWLTVCQSGAGNVGYVCASGWEETSGISGLSAIGFMLHDKPEQALKTTNCWVSTDGELTGARCGNNSHANSSFGLTWSTAAMVALRHSKKVKKSQGEDATEGYRVYMDYWKWYFSLGQAPEGSNVVHYFIPSKGNCGGDGYLGYDMINHASHAMAFATSKQALFVHGNNRENWYNKRELLRRLGLLDKVEKLCKKIDAFEKARKFKEAYQQLMALKELDPENDYMFEKPRDWATYANTEINRTLPDVADRNYFTSEKEVKAVLKKYGPEIATRAKFFGDLLDSSVLAKNQRLDGPKAEAIVRDVEYERISAQTGLSRLDKIIRKYKGTGFNRHYAAIMGEWRVKAEADKEKKKEDVEVKS